MAVLMPADDGEPDEPALHDLAEQVQLADESARWEGCRGD
jgi:hypothetical protein